MWNEAPWMRQSWTNRSGHRSRHGQLLSLPKPLQRSTCSSSCWFVFPSLSYSLLWVSLGRQLNTKNANALTPVLRCSAVFADPVQSLDGWSGKLGAKWMNVNAVIINITPHRRNCLNWCVFLKLLVVFQHPPCALSSSSACAEAQINLNCQQLQRRLFIAVPVSSKAVCKGDKYLSCSCYVSQWFFSYSNNVQHKIVFVFCEDVGSPKANP